VPLGEADWLAGPAGPQLPASGDTAADFYALRGRAQRKGDRRCRCRRDRQALGLVAFGRVKNFDF
jgi:hypothetical protein